jgi:phosphoribosyl 1,2-cyclic phosphodiesterase/CheY-like chemotaxis protein
MAVYRMKTILLIDDDEMCRTPAAELLRAEQWHVLEAEDGERGIEMALQHRPDIILCDLLMPRGNGFHVCRAVREHLELRHTKIIVVTGRDYPTDRKTAEEAGADEYLVKPIEFARLQEALQRVLPPELPGSQVGAPPSRSSVDQSTRIKFWGVRGSIPTPGPSTVFFGGNTSCVEIRSDGELILLDAGSGIRPAGLAIAEEFRGQPIEMTLLVTHTHWDHIQGFPFFLPAYDPKNRLRICGYEGASDGLHSTLAGQMESPYFPIALDQMPGNIIIEELKEMHFSVGSIRAEACFVNHPGVCVGYRLSTSGGAVVYMPDNETFNRTGAPSSTGKNGTFLPCTLENHLVDFIKDAEVLIVDSQYNAAEYLTHVGWGHGCVDEVVKLAIAGNVRRLYLFHHDPAHDDRFISSMLVHARQIAAEAGSSIHIEAAREGEQVVLEALPTPVQGASVPLPGCRPSLSAAPISAASAE